METRQFNVTGMSCAACSSRVEKAVCALRGVSAAEVNLLTNSLKATFDEGVLGVDDGADAARLLGFGYHVDGQGGLTRRFRTVYLGDSAAWHTAYAKGIVKAQ